MANEIILILRSRTRKIRRGPRCIRSPLADREYMLFDGSKHSWKSCVLQQFITWL